MPAQNFPNHFHSLRILKMKEMKPIVLTLTGKDNTSYPLNNKARVTTFPSPDIFHFFLHCSSILSSSQASFLDKHFLLDMTEINTWIERNITPQSLYPRLNAWICKRQGENYRFYEYFSFPNTNILINIHVSQRKSRKKDGCNMSLADKKLKVSSVIFAITSF